jgi:hypothetical protein
MATPVAANQRDLKVLQQDQSARHDEISNSSRKAAAVSTEPKKLYLEFNR